MEHKEKIKELIEANQIDLAMQLMKGLNYTSDKIADIIIDHIESLTMSVDVAMKHCLERITFGDVELIIANQCTYIVRCGGKECKPAERITLDEIRTEIRLINYLS